MDIGNLEKLKVAELRNELKIRGLDTKGVKAVLVERLRCFLQDGVVSNAPSRRSRRTKSKTRSPSPTVGKKTIVSIEALALGTVSEEAVPANNNETRKGSNECNEDIKLLNAPEEHIAENTNSTTKEGDKEVMRVESPCEKSKQNLSDTNTAEREDTVHLPISKLNEVGCIDETTATIENVTNQQESGERNCQNAISKLLVNEMDKVQKDQLTTTKVEIYGEYINMDVNINDKVEKNESDSERSPPKDEDKTECQEENELYSCNLEVAATHKNSDNDRQSVVVNPCLANVNERQEGNELYSCNLEVGATHKNSDDDRQSVFVNPCLANVNERQEENELYSCNLEVAATHKNSDDDRQSVFINPCLANVNERQEGNELYSYNLEVAATHKNSDDDRQSVFVNPSLANVNERQEGNELYSCNLEVTATHKNNDDDRQSVFVNPCLANVNERQEENELYSCNLEVAATHKNSDDDHQSVIVNPCLANVNEQNRSVDNSPINVIFNQYESESFNCTTPNQSIASEKISHEINESKSLDQLPYMGDNDKDNIMEETQEPQKPNEEYKDGEKKKNKQDKPTTIHEHVHEDDNGKKALSSNSLVKGPRRCKRSHSGTSLTSSHQRRSYSRSRSRSRYRSRSRSRSIKHCTTSRYNDTSVKNKNDDDTASLTAEDEPIIDEYHFGLSWFDSDLHLCIDPVTFTSARPMNQDIYALIWSGARSNYGVREGKVCFEVRISDENILGRSHEFRHEPHVYGFRIGFSILSTSLLLGEADNSYAYCESGKKVTKGEFTAYGPSYGLYDVVGCYLDLDSKPCSIQYTLNGKALGVAFEFDKSVLDEAKNAALFPHILTKGYEYQVNFADKDNVLLNVERKVRKRKKSKKEMKEMENKSDVGAKMDVKDKAKAYSTDINYNKCENVQQTAEKAEATVEIDGDAVKGKTKVLENELQDIKTVTTTNMKTRNEESLSQLKQGEEGGPPLAEYNNSKEYTGEENSYNSNIMKTADDADDKRCGNDKNGDEYQPSPNKRKKMEYITKHNSSNEHGGHENYDNNVMKDEIKPNTTTESVSETKSKAKYSLTLLPNYELIALLPKEKYVMGSQRPGSRKDCEVILMIGLPGSGKTTWVQKHCADNAEKLYNVIGADALIDKMTVDGTDRKSIHKGRFDRVYELCFNIIPSLEGIAVKRRRNYILDQTNAYASTQRRKMKGFSKFKRVAVVCLPKADELKRRLADKKDKGHHIYTMKESTFRNTQANFSLPSLEFGWFDDIIYTDLSGDEAKKEVKEINKVGKKTIEQTSSGSGSGSASGSNNDRGSDRSGNINKRIKQDYNRRGYNRRPNDDYNRRYDHDNRWSNNRRSGGNNMSTNFNYSQYGSGSSGGGGIGIYRNAKNRNYNQRFMGGQQNWVQGNNRNNRYDDYRNYRTGGSGGNGNGGIGNRYNAYNSSGNMRNSNNNGDYRDRNNRDRNRNNSYGGSNNVSGSTSASGRHSFDNRSTRSQRNFRIGHRDTREDNRGGSALTNAEATKYEPFNKTLAQPSNGLSTTAFDSYTNSSNNNSNGNNQQKVMHTYARTMDNAKWNTLHEQQQQQMPQYNHQYQPAQETNDWQMYTQQMGAHHPQQQGHWNYNMTDYGQWQSTNQQHQWMTWWQQQQQGQIGGATEMSASSNQQYWSHYSYNTTAATSTTQQQQQISAVDSNNPSSNCITMATITTEKK